MTGELWEVQWKDTTTKILQQSKTLDAAELNGPKNTHQ